MEKITEANEMVNGKYYPMWSQFVTKKDNFIGRKLTDYDHGESFSTEITGVTLEPNGKDSAYFLVVGKEFSCGFDVRHGGIDGSRCKDGILAFYGYGGHVWEIETDHKPQQQ